MLKPDQLKGMAQIERTHFQKNVLRVFIQYFTYSLALFSCFNLPLSHFPVCFASHLHLIRRLLIENQYMRSVSRQQLTFIKFQIFLGLVIKDVRTKIF